MNQNNTRVADRKEEKPPYSRIFVVCNKQWKEDDLRRRFERFGDIEDLYIPKDRNTGESKGLAYIKYSKTTSAAAAIREVHMKTFKNESRPTKVMVAMNKNENPAQIENEDRYRRLFIKVHKESTESEVRHYFSTFGQVESIRLLKDKLSDTCRGFAYVRYKSFYDAAKAFEECDNKYKPVFAAPRDDLKRSLNSLDLRPESNHNLNSYSAPKYIHNNTDKNNAPKIECLDHDRNISITKTTQDFNTIAVICSPQVPQKHVQQLFDIVPGMAQFQYSVDISNGISRASITYETNNSASYALDKLNNYEFPSGEILTVKPDKNPLSKAANDLTDMVNSFKNAVDSGSPDLQQLADVIARASSMIKAATLITNQTEPTRETPDPSISNVSLPPPKPMADFYNRVAQRLFFICKPRPPPNSTLQDLFCRFGDLIHVSSIGNKTYGFAKYASSKSAQEAIKFLNGATFSGIRLKVMEADEKPCQDKDQKANDKSEEGEAVVSPSSLDYDMESKRMKLNDHD